MTFCSRASLAAGEPFAGTGVRGRAYVLLPVPKGQWGEREMNSGWASPEELAAVRAARPGGVVVRLYNPPQKPGGAILVHAGPDAPQAALAALLAVFAPRWPIEASPPPTLAICTHGTRDRCCAKWGFAAFQQARRLFEAGRSVFRPAECSHLGGDRFAATGVFFPSGSMYAHLDAIDLEALCAAEAGGRLSPEAYRGRVFDPPAAQLARAGLARAGLADSAAAPLIVEREDAGALEVRTGGDRYRLSLGSRELSFFGSCDALEAGRPSLGLRKVVESAHRLGPAAVAEPEPHAPKA
jgi:hypothetical protein